MIITANREQLLNLADPPPVYLEIGGFKLELVQEQDQLVIRTVGANAKLAVLPQASNTIRLRRG